MDTLLAFLRNASVAGILAVALPLAYATWQLFRELRHRNEIERAKIEADYLRAALDVCHVPTEAMIAAAFEFSQHVGVAKQPARIDGRFAEPVAKAWNEFAREMDRFNKSVKVALAFARRAGAEPLARCLVAVHKSSNELGALIQPLMTGELTSGNIESTDAFRQAFSDADRASDLLVDRIAEIYGVRRQR
jgi:hypothetical protein